MNGQWQQCRAGRGRRQGHGVRVRGVVGV